MIPVARNSWHPRIATESGLPSRQAAPSSTITTANGFPSATQARSVFMAKSGSSVHVAAALQPRVQSDINVRLVALSWMTSTRVPGGALRDERR